MSNTTLTVLCGAPASGKSTWAEANRGDAVVLTADAARLNRNQRMMNQLHGIMLIAPQHLRRGKDVIVDATASKPEHRATWIQIAQRTRARTRLVVFTTPLDVCLYRNSQRTRGIVPTAIVIQQHQAISTADFNSEPWDEVIRL